MNKVTPFLMFNDQLEAAMELYTATFPDSEIRNVARTGKDGPVTSAEFVVGGQVFMGYNGGPIRQPHMRVSAGQMATMRNAAVASGLDVTTDDDALFYTGRNPR